MRATLLLTAMLVAGTCHAETETVTIPSSPSVAETPAATCPCAETSTIDLGAAPEPESIVTIAPSASPPTATGFGSGARSWMDLQTSGSAASTTARPLPGDVATHVYERYANSFKHPIPETFEPESFSTDARGQ